MQQKQRTDQLENKVIGIENDINDIKQLLKQVLKNYDCRHYQRKR
jgi:hypothetical protein